MKSIKKINLLFLWLFVMVFFFICITPTYAKFAGSFNGSLGSISVGRGVTIPPEGETGWAESGYESGNLYGSGSITYDPNYALNTLQNKQFSVGNQSGKRLLIEFQFILYHINAASIFKITVKTGDYSVTVSAFDAKHDDDLSTSTISFNPSKVSKITKEDREKYFVVDDGDTITYTLSIDYTGEASNTSYVEVKLIAVVYEE